MELKDYVLELQTQETLATARPIIIALQVKERVFVGADCDYEASGPAKDAGLTESPEDLGLDPEQTLHWRDTWVDKAWFLTHSGYEEHLQLNRHNYRGEIRKFVHHAFRAPEFKRIYAWLEELVRLREEIERLRAEVKTLDAANKLNAHEKYIYAGERDQLRARVAELEAEDRENALLVKRQAQDNARLRETLEFYASKENNTPTGNLCEEVGPIWTRPSAVSEDDGEGDE
jgi:hypothetical protein